MTDEELAKEEYKRRMAANDKAGLLGRRGVFPMYHRLFYQYLRWVVAEIAPSAQPSSLHWSQGEEHDRHVSYFGKQWGVHNVDRHLTELLGKQFTRIFGREATITDYQYVAEIITKTKLKPEDVPVTMTRAVTWLNEQIAQLRNSDDTPDRLVIPSVSNEEDLVVSAPDLPQELDTHQHEIAEYLPLIEDALHAEESTPSVDKPAPTVEDLCIAPFTEADLASLLRSLGVLDGQNNCLTNNKTGKAQGERSVFTAAYRVLQRHGLMAATTNNAGWASAFKAAYDADIGVTARAYKLSANGKAPTIGSDYFKDGVEATTSWLAIWQEKQLKTDEN